MNGEQDVAARLGQGRPAVHNTQSYVAACQVLGYRHPDLTGHARQVQDWYESQAGLDLRVLDDDCAALWSATTTAEEALATHRTQLAELAAAWRGSAADYAIRFLQRHCDAAAAVAERVRAAAEGCSALRETLWQLVDGKVARAIAIDDRALAGRAEWLAAAHAVRTGQPDRSAEEIIRLQVNPYVDNDIRVEWLAVMRSTTASVDESFDAVTDGLATLPGGCFELIGDLGPSPSAATAPSAVSSLAGAVPAIPAAAPPPSSQSPAPPGFPQPVAPPAELGDAAGLPGGPGDLGGAGGLAGLAGSIGGVVGRIVDGIDDLLGSLGGALADRAPDDAAFDDPLEADEAVDPVVERPDENAAEEADTDDTDDTDETDETDETDDTDDDESATADQTTDQSPSATADPLADSTTPESTAAPAEPAPADKTPCEIAADELPQAGQ